MTHEELHPVPQNNRKFSSQKIEDSNSQFLNSHLTLPKMKIKLSQDRNDWSCNNHNINDITCNCEKWAVNEFP